MTQEPTVEPANGSQTAPDTVADGVTGRAPAPAIEVRGLERRFGDTEALRGLDLTVGRGRCHGFFGRNGAGKTTTLKCLLDLVRPDAGEVRVFGLDPRRDPVGVKRRLAYVPDQVDFYPWMSVREVLDYLASFRGHWNRDLEARLLAQFGLGEERRAKTLSKGQKMQLALVGAISPEPDLLVLDEPTSGLDPIVRRDFIQTVIGAYQDPDPENRTLFVSTHLIREFEGLVDAFTVIEEGRELLTLEADEARESFSEVHLSYRGGAAPSEADLRAVEGVRAVRGTGAHYTLAVQGDAAQTVARLRALQPAPADAHHHPLALEEIFMAVVSG